MKISFFFFLLTTYKDVRRLAPKKCVNKQLVNVSGRKGIQEFWKGYSGILEGTSNFYIFLSVLFRKN